MTNTIEFKDFYPEVKEKSFWKGNTYQTVEELMDEVNAWVRKNYNMEIINVETIQSFNGYHKQMSKLNSTSSSRFNANGGYVYVIQYIRVWYKAS